MDINIKTISTQKTKANALKKKIEGLMSQSPEALIPLCLCLRGHSRDKWYTKTHTYPSFRPLQRAGWWEIGSWSRTRQCYSLQLPATPTERERERETHYKCDLRHAVAVVKALKPC